MLALVLMLTVMDDPDIVCPLVIVDKVEKNYVYNQNGHHYLTQYIGYVWHEDRRAYHVAFWSLERNVRFITQDERTTLLTIWKKDVLVRVRTDVYYECASMEDHELIDRQLLSKEKRRGGELLR